MESREQEGRQPSARTLCLSATRRQVWSAFTLLNHALSKGTDMRHLNRRTFLGVAGTGTLAALIPTSGGATTTHTTCPTLSFLQLSDTHIPTTSGLARTRRVVEAIQTCSLPYDLIVHTGDVSHGRGNVDDMTHAHRVLTFTKPTYFVPGNHDVTFDHPEAYEPVFSRLFGPCNHAFSPVPGVRFVLLNSQALSDRADAFIREQALEDLTNLLSPSMPTIVFCHATGLPDFYENTMHPGWNTDTMTTWAAIMKHGGVFAVLAGHFHRDECHVLGTITVHLCAPVVGWWGRQATFRHWVLKDGLLTYRTIYV